MIRKRDAERLGEIVARFAGRKVAVLGDLVVDEFVHGDIARVSREAPVLVLDHARTVLVPGGGANSVANLRALGARPIPVGVVGRDAAGRGLVRQFRASGITTSKIIAVDGYDTPCKSRVLAGGIHTRRQQIVRIDRGARRAELPADTARRLRRNLEAALERGEGLLVADYGYGAASPSRFGAQLRRAVKQDKPVTVDSRARITEFNGVSACTPNQEEVELALDATLENDATVVAAGKRLLRRTNNTSVLITRGARGMSLLGRGSRPLHIEAYGTDEIADVTGAGDTVIAAFTLALVCGAAPADAARLSNYAAGLVVVKSGTATIDSDELLHAIREDTE
ncbi:MAG: hypothetical protein GY716_25355 [bacterium]|nr:hypothetical protein [bacterium]